MPTTKPLGKLENEFLLACERQDTNLVKRLLAQGANPKVCSHQAILWACYKGHLEILKELSKHYSPTEINHILSHELNRKGDVEISKMVKKNLNYILKEMKKESIKLHLSQNSKTFEL